MNNSYLLNGVQLGSTEVVVGVLPNAIWHVDEPYFLLFAMPAYPTARPKPRLIMVSIRRVEVGVVIQVCTIRFTAGPLKTFRVIFLIIICVDGTVAVFIVICPKVRGIIWFQFSCK